MVTAFLTLPFAFPFQTKSSVSYADLFGRILKPTCEISLWIPVRAASATLLHTLASDRSNLYRKRKNVLSGLYPSQVLPQILIANTDLETSLVK